MRKLEAGDQGVDHLRDGTLVGHVETVPPDAELVGDFDVGVLGSHEIDALVPSRQVIYRSTGTARRVTVAPLLTGDTRGLAVALGF